MGRAFQVALLAAGGLYAASLAAPARAADSVCPAVCQLPRKSFVRALDAIGRNSIATEALDDLRLIPIF